MTAKTGLNMRIDAALRAKLKVRNPKPEVENPGVIARRDLERWYTALQDALQQIMLDPAEAVLLIAVVGREGLHNETLAATLATHVSEFLEEGYGHVRNRLVQKVETWDRITRWAVIDACERYVVYQEQNPESSLGLALHEIGLHHYESSAYEVPGDAG